MLVRSSAKSFFAGIGVCAATGLLLGLPTASFAGYWQTDWHMRAGDALGESKTIHGTMGVGAESGLLQGGSTNSAGVTYTTAGSNTPFAEATAGSPGGNSAMIASGGSSAIIVSATWITSDPINDPAPGMVTIQFKRKMAGNTSGYVEVEPGTSGHSSGTMSCKFVGTDDIVELPSDGLGGSCDCDADPYGSGNYASWGSDFSFEDDDDTLLTLNTDSNGVASIEIPVSWGFSESASMSLDHGNSDTDAYGDVTFTIEDLAVVWDD